MKLDVYVDDKQVGSLEQADITSYVFRYNDDATDAQMVSLLMPPSAKREWEHRFLHPVFQVSLPEGTLRQILTRTFAKQFGTFGETELLATIGSHLVGRVKVAPAGKSLKHDGPGENLRELLGETNEQMLDHYLGVHAQYSGVSGGYTKFLAKSPSNSEEASGRATLTFDHWIVKADDEDHPNLVINEFFCLEACRRMDLPTPEFHLSADGLRMAIRRFDYDERGKHMGFEDMCALLGYNASDKFSGSVEAMIKRINEFCPPAEARRAKEIFYAQYLACMALRNGDAHLKNFGLLYTDFEDVRLAPVYDMVTMSAYAPSKENGDTADSPALSLSGRRHWMDERDRAALAARCGITPLRQREIAQRLCTSVANVALEMAERGAVDERFTPMAKRMLELWGHGVALHDQAIARQLQELAEELKTELPVYIPRARARL